MFCIRCRQDFGTPTKYLPTKISTYTNKIHYHCTLLLYTNWCSIKEEDRSPQNGCQKSLVDHQCSPDATVGIQESPEESEHLEEKKQYRTKDQSGLVRELNPGPLAP